MSARLAKARRVQAVVRAQEKCARLRLTQAQGNVHKNNHRAAQLNELAQQMSHCESVNNGLELSAQFGFSTRLLSAARAVLENTSVLEAKADAAKMDHAASLRRSDMAFEKYVAARKEYSAKQDLKNSLTSSVRTAELKP